MKDSFRGEFSYWILRAWGSWPLAYDKDIVMEVESCSCTVGICDEGLIALFAAKDSGLTTQFPCRRILWEQFLIWVEYWLQALATTPQGQSCEGLRFSIE